MDAIVFFFFNDTATTEIYTLSLHDALPIFEERKIALGNAALLDGLGVDVADAHGQADALRADGQTVVFLAVRSEEHTSELQSLAYLVCRLLLEKKKIIRAEHRHPTLCGRDS